MVAVLAVVLVSLLAVAGGASSSADGRWVSVIVQAQPGGLVAAAGGSSGSVARSAASWR